MEVEVDMGCLIPWVTGLQTSERDNLEIDASTFNPKLRLRVVPTRPLRERPCLVDKRSHANIQTNIGLYCIKKYLHSFMYPLIVLIGYCIVPVSCHYHPFRGRRWRGQAKIPNWGRALLCPPPPR